jgi:hypothetical protein
MASTDDKQRVAYTSSLAEDHTVRLDPNSMFSRRVPLEADILIYFSTTDGYISWRHPKQGSWFIESLCYVLNKYAAEPNIELNTLLLKVNNRVAIKYKQMPEIVSRLRKEFYFNFNPTLYFADDSRHVSSLLKLNESQNLQQDSPPVQNQHGYSMNNKSYQMKQVNQKLDIFCFFCQLLF